MNLLFNHDNKGSEEFADTLGFVYEGFDYNKIKFEIKAATRSIIDLVGLGVYTQAQVHYLNRFVVEDPVVDIDPVVPEPEPEPEILDPESETLFIPSIDYLDELLEMLQYAIALDAYSQAAPNSDIAHTPNGRKMRTDANEKQAFEWMLDRDNEQRERKYYKVQDELLKLIDLDPLWRESDNYNAMHSSWVSSTDVLQRYYPEGNRLLLLRIAPGILDAQESHIASRLPVIYSEIAAAIQSGLPVDDKYSDLLKKAQEACVYGGLIWGLRRLRVTMFPEGILQSSRGDRNNVSARMTPLDLSIQATAQVFSSDLDRVLSDIDHEYHKLTATPVVHAPVFKEPDNTDKYVDL